MGVDYFYYCGYIDNKTKKIHGLGPYDDQGRLRSTLWKGSSASDLKEMFRHVEVDELDDSLKKIFVDKGHKEEERSYCYMLKFSDLPKGEYIKSGYFLMQDVDEYMKAMEEYGWADANEYFYNGISPLIYTEMVKDEAMFGRPQHTEDESGCDTTPKCASDYMWYVYPDYSCIEYECFLIRNMMGILDDHYSDNRDITKVILLRKDW